MTDPYIAQGVRRFWPGALGGRALGVNKVDARRKTQLRTESVETCVTFHFTGGAQTFTVPGGITEVSLAVFGADGAVFGGVGDQSGIGGGAFGTLTVTPGDVLDLYVGGHPTQEPGDNTGDYTWPAGHGRHGGWPDGGDAPPNPVAPDDFDSRLFAGGGGGSSRIERSGTILLQAGGGGGGTSDSPSLLGAFYGGGRGGDPDGYPGQIGGAGGGTSSAGGAAGSGTTPTAGAYQAGGIGGQDYSVVYSRYTAAGGGGGGGYYGGGGGATGTTGGSPNYLNLGGPGGGGASYADGSVTGASFGPARGLPGSVFDTANDGHITICYQRLITVPA